MAAHSFLVTKIGQTGRLRLDLGLRLRAVVSYAVPDANILSMSTHVEMMRAIASTDIPLIADIDTGFGTAVNVHYVVPQ